MRRQFFKVAAALTVVLLSSPAYARCAEFEVSPGDLTVRYDPFLNTTIDRPFTMRIRRLDPSVTAVRLVLAGGGISGGRLQVGPNGPTGYDITWNRETSRRVLVAGAEQPNPTNGALVQFGEGHGGDMTSETFRLRMPSGQTAQGGTFYQPFEVRYLCLTGKQDAGTLHVQTGSQIALTLDVPQLISSYIGSVGQKRGLIDFGALAPATGAPPRSIAVTVQATVPYSVVVRANRGALKRHDNESAAIPYRLKLAGMKIESGSRLSCDTTPAPTGRSHMLGVELDARAAANVPAGLYSDVVTLTFVPRAGLDGGGSGCSSF